MRLIAEGLFKTTRLAFSYDPLAPSPNRLGAFFLPAISLVVAGMVGITPQP